MPGKSSDKRRLIAGFRKPSPLLKEPDHVVTGMKRLYTLILVLLAGFRLAAEPTWNPANAVKEAEQDIRSGHIKFYWAGSVGVGPVGVPMEVAKKYPRVDAGVGCVTNDIPLRERQEEYARLYNQKIYAYVTQRH